MHQLQPHPEAVPRAAVNTASTSLQIPPFLRRFPNVAFTIPVGWAASSIMWKTLAASPWASEYVADTGNWFFWVGGCVIFCIIMLVYGLKCVSGHFDVVKSEWKDPVRSYLFIAPLVALLLLFISIPADLERGPPVVNATLVKSGATVFIESTNRGLLYTRRAVYGVVLVLQLFFWVMFLTRWTTLTEHRKKLDTKSIEDASPAASGVLSEAKANYLLVTICWFLLTVFGQQIGIRPSWGIDLPAMTFGAGCLGYSLTIMALFQNFFKEPPGKNPVIALVIAPPSVACVALSNFFSEPTHVDPATGGILRSRFVFGTPATALLGMIYGMVFLFAYQKLRWQNFRRVNVLVLGFYHVYAFPVTALATATIRYATTENTLTARVLAIIMVCLATLIIFTTHIVLLKRLITINCCNAANSKEPHDVWNCPLAIEMDRQKKEMHTKAFVDAQHRNSGDGTQRDLAPILPVPLDRSRPSLPTVWPPSPPEVLPQQREAFPDAVVHMHRGQHNLIEL